MANTKTIVITTLPGRSGSSPLVRKIELNTDHILDDEPLEPGRKRRRLTHLSPEEKMLRRKLKNRVAAQTARDRKKERMTQLEEELAELQKRNQELLAQNRNLQQKSGVLLKENQELKQRLGIQADQANTASTNSSVIVTKKEHESPESAVLTPLPQEMILALSQSMTHCVAYLITLSLISLIYSNKSKPPTSNNLKVSTNQPPVTFPPQMAPLLRWWGPQQKTWNPSMNS